MSETSKVPAGPRLETSARGGGCLHLRRHPAQVLSLSLLLVTSFQHLLFY